MRIEPKENSGEHFIRISFIGQMRMYTRTKTHLFRGAKRSTTIATAAVTSAADTGPQKPSSNVKRALLTLAPERRVMISEAAYFMAEHRGFEPEHEMQDWLLAEIQIDVSQGGAGPPAAARS
jgi:predicted protein tyrosine phosphatase